MHITAAEAHVMEALWRRQPMSADDLVAEVGASQQWGEATVKTLINRLLKKKAIKSERADGKHGYRPLIDRSAYVHSESQGLLDRLFDGRLAPLVSHFSKREKLNPEDIAELRRLLDKIDDDQ